jgi:hypothetical protein
MKKKKNTKTAHAKQVAKKKVAKKQTAKKSVKAKVKKTKKAVTAKAKKKLQNKLVTKKTAKKVSKLKVKSTKTKLPGYPHYSAKDDIMNTANKSRKVNIEDGDNKSVLKKKISKPYEEFDEKPLLSDIKNKKTRNSKSLTKEDQDLLGSDELNPDLGEDEVLKERVWPVDMAGDDLDIPGSELDDANEIIGEEDEENNNYSIGGDRHDDLDENPDSGL